MVKIWSISLIFQIFVDVYASTIYYLTTPLIIILIRAVSRNYYFCAPANQQKKRIIHASMTN
jgi:hypothetical protein